MTSNVGSRELEEYGNGVGFNTASRNILMNRKSVVEKAVKKAFPPEFINRVDEQVFFNSLDKEDLEKIIDIEMKGLKERVKEAGFELIVTSGAKRFVADAGYNPDFGARPLKRAIQKYIEDPVSEQIIIDRMSGGSRKGCRLRVSPDKTQDGLIVEWKEA
jgi:ATP-dependent Clp protease ATP-binding subunit ClpC